MTTTALEETRAEVELYRYYDPTTAQFTTPDPLYAITGSVVVPSRAQFERGLPWVGVAGEAVSYGASWVPGCVTIGNNNCTSLGDTHPVARDALYVTAGAAATVASGGLALDAAGVISLGTGSTALAAEGVASAGVGVFAASGDYGRCRGGDELACVAMWSGVSGATSGGFGLIPGSVGLGLAWLGLFPSGVGLTLDSYGLAREARERLGCS